MGGGQRIGPDEKPVYIDFSCEGAGILEYNEIMGGMDVVGYSLKVKNLRVDGEVVAGRLTIPLTAEQYHTLKEQYETSGAEEATFSLGGKLEVIVRPVSLN